MGISSRYVKGIEIELGGNATKLKTALDDANKGIRTTQMELDTLRNSLKLEWNVDNFKRAQELAQRAVQQTRDKADMLRKALAELDKQGDKVNAEQYEAVRRELSYVEVAAQKARKEMSELSGLEFSKMKTSAESAKTELEKMRKALDGKWSQENFNAAQRAAQENVVKTGEYVDALREKIEQLSSAGEDADAGLALEQLSQELNDAEEAAESAGQQMDELGDLSLKNLEESFSDAGERLESMGGILTVGVTAPLVAAGTAAVNFASGMAESLNKVEVAFTFAAEGVKNWSDTTLTSIGLAKGTALDMAALFGDMATSMNINAASAADMSMELVNLAADLSSFKNIGIEQSLNALKGVFTGEGESLKSLGVIMTDATLKAYAMSQGYKVVYDKMDQAQKVAVRYGYILEQTKNAQGDFARTSDGTANQLRILQESLKEAASTMGNDLLPIVTPLITQLGGLVQSFAQMDEGTRKVVVQAALFAAALGPMLKLMGLMTTAAKTGAVAYAAYTAAKAADITVTNGATAAQIALNAAFGMTPIGAAITAVGALVAVLGALAVAQTLTAEKTETEADKTEKLVESIEKAREARQKEIEAIEEEQVSTMNMVKALEAALAVEEKSAAQKAIIKGLVEDINEAMPDMALAYDAETDSLNLTTEALERYVEVQAKQELRQEKMEALIQLEKDRIGLADQLAATEIEAAEAQAKFNEEYAKAQTMANHYNPLMGDVNSRNQAAQAALESLTAQQEANAQEVAQLKDEYNDLSAATDAAAQETRDLARETGLLGDEAEDAYAALSAVLEQVQGRYELLAKAQGEMNDAGYLSLSTVSSLLEKYPDLAGYLVEAEGGYQLATGALERYIAAQRTEYQIAEQQAAAAAQRVIASQAGILGAVNATTASIETQLLAIMALYSAQTAFGDDWKNSDDYYAHGDTAMQVGSPDPNYIAAKNAYDAYIAAKKSVADMDRVTASLGRESAAGGGGKSGKGDTEEEKRLAAFQKVMEQVEFLLDTGEITEEQYYIKLEQMRDKYLTEGSDEWRDATVKLYDYKQGAYERELAILDESLANQEITLQQHMDGLAGIQSKYLKEGTAGWRENAERQAADQKAMYDEELADTEYFHNMGIIDDREYYRQRAALRDKYLEEDSEAWRRDMEEQHKFEQQQREAFLTAARKATEDAEKRSTDLLKQFSEERIAQIKAEQQAQEDRINAEIDGINEQIDARRRLRQEESDEDAVAKAKKTLDAAQGELSYARDEFERAELEKEVQRAQEAYDKALRDKDDNDWEYAKQQEIKAKQDELEAVKDQAEKDIVGAEAYAKKRLEEYEEAAARREQREREEEDAELAQLLGSGWKHSAQRTQRAASGALSAATAQAVTQIFSSAANSVTTNHNNVTMSMPTAPLTSWQLAQGIKKAFDAMESK